MLTFTKKVGILEIMKLAEYLKKEKLTQEDFAKRIGVVPQSVSNYVTGMSVPKRAVAKKIIEVTCGEVSLADIWGIPVRGDH